ncbi:MAG: DUF350 domain-containing protein [Bacteroidetes bacterium]|nr:MAG: DUF350 domain-containing protein [Bacteroidota bacterium]TNE96969.1 MAG: DUF350 domain-containing protein [Bacteroidota bacterium]
MNEKIAVLGLVEILSSLSSGIVILYLTYKLVRVYGRKKLQIEHDNTAYNVLLAGVLFSVGYIVSGVVQPILDSYRFLSGSDISKSELVMSFIGYGGLYIAITYILAMLVVISGVKIYSTMTPLNEAEEIRNNNIGVSIVLTVVIITLSIFCSSGINLLVESFIPYPEMPYQIK